ncbi:MAG: DUF1353 domain-containing protein [Prosthecobacter sp.]
MKPLLKSPDIEPIRDASFGFPLMPWSVGKLFELREDYPFTVRNSGFEAHYLIPAGYQFDKASIPPLFWGWPFNYTPDGLCTVPALEHDFLCDLFTGGSEWLKGALADQYPESLPAEVIHRHFYHRLLDWGVRLPKARVFWAGVRNFGPGGRLRPSVLWSQAKQNLKRIMP